MRTTDAPRSSANVIEGNAAAMRAVFVIAPVCLSCGTLKSTRMSTRLPARSRSRMDLNLGMTDKWRGMMCG